MEAQRPYWEETDHEDEEESYVPDDQLMAADELPPPPALPEQNSLRCEVESLATSLPSRPALAYHLGRGRYVTLSHFRQGLTFHVREFGVNGITSKRYPTPKGVCLDHVQVRSLIHYFEEIRTRIHNADIATAANWHLGKLAFASFDPEYQSIINLRHFFIPENENRLQATRRGITLNKTEIDMLAVVLQSKLEPLWPSLANHSKPCFIQHTEHNDEERAKVQCSYCSPLLGL